MHVISRKTLQEFWISHPEVEEALRAWYHEARTGRWNTPQEIRSRYRSADFLPGNRVVFNIKGNQYRLVVKINYASGTVFIRFIGDHADYDRIDAEKV